MSKDSSFSQIHRPHAHYAQYVAEWVHDKLPNDPIDTPTISLGYDDDDNDGDEGEPATMQNSSFGAIKNKLRKDAIWKDLRLDKIMNDDPKWWRSVQDTSILKRLDKSSDENPEDEMIEGTSAPEVLVGNAVGPSQSRQNTLGQNTLQVPGNSGEITTPEMLRNRGGQRSMQNFQTPIGRIMR
ncbi:CYFA0S45e00100g1_1 [Cyberlindnera fabianii]|uniref:Anaphase-promoting complex subunit 13 n=1 Tax=Cyberlindnera fabianii TaxID=36022 RepID=A0A061BLW9_CYBFA|nr:Anaphase-promoting complex subunit 13 [Cyberlindnera fabianii]CDR48043.1 CYFA0S45e00100g1_1 [Cyberlindnera fabianii]